MSDGQIAGFICITGENFIKGLFVDPQYRRKGIGAKLLQFAKETYSILHVKVYAKNRSMLAFATHTGFVIDGAVMHRETGEIRYSMIWNENE
jgi:putative acetyltransferase